MIYFLIGFFIFAFGLSCAASLATGDWRYAAFGLISLPIYTYALWTGVEPGIGWQEGFLVGSSWVTIFNLNNENTKTITHYVGSFVGCVIFYGLYYYAGLFQ